MAEYSGGIVLAVCVVVVAGALTGLYLLAVPTSRLSRWFDRKAREMTK